MQQACQLRGRTTARSSPACPSSRARTWLTWTSIKIGQVSTRTGRREDARNHEEERRARERRASALSARGRVDSSQRTQRKGILQGYARIHRKLGSATAGRSNERALAKQADNFDNRLKKLTVPPRQRHQNQEHPANTVCTRGAQQRRSRHLQRFRNQT